MTYAAMKPIFLCLAKNLHSGNHKMVAGTTNVEIFEQRAYNARENVKKQTNEKQSTAILHLSLLLGKLEHGSPGTGATIEGTPQVKHNVQISKCCVLLFLCDSVIRQRNLCSSA